MYIYISIHSDIKYCIVLYEGSRDLGLVAWKFEDVKRLLWAGYESEIVQETQTGRVNEKKHFLSPNT